MIQFTAEQLEARDATMRRIGFLAARNGAASPHPSSSDDFLAYAKRIIAVDVAGVARVEFA